MEKIIEQLEENSLLRIMAISVSTVLSVMFGLSSIAAFVLGFSASAWFLLGILPCAIACGVTAGFAGWIYDEFC